MSGVSLELWVRHDLEGGYQIATEKPTDGVYWTKYVLADYARRVIKSRLEGETGPIKHIDDPERANECAVEGCPEVGTLSRGVNGGVQFYCASHFWGN